LAFAVNTLPLTLDPFGMAVLPSTVTGCATVAMNACPVWLVFELSA
jgi:hypothetical protein